jgi:enoyl-CoA hydratase/carnithine racemase
MVCDIVIADRTARFGLPEARVGLAPGLGLARGTSQLNLHWMKFLVLTGEMLDAEEARLAGIVNRITAPGEHVAAAEALARGIAEHAPLALAVGKDVLGRQTPDASGEAIDAVGMLMGTEDFGEGIAAFRERRPPRFQAR